MSTLLIKAVQRCILCVHSQLDRRWAGETPEGETANQDSNSEFDDSDDESDGRSNPYAMVMVLPSLPYSPSLPH